MLNKLVAILLLTCPAWAADVYFAQAGSGLNNGASCANAFNVTRFNTNDSNWSAGNTLHLCGTFTAASANTTMLTVQAGGTVGNPITVLFEPGAVLTSPAWSTTTGAIFINGKSNVTIDGGTNGLITATANGTGLASTIDSAGVTSVTNGATSPTVTHVTVKNLTITNLFVRTRHAESSGTAPGFNSVAINIISGGNNLITGNIVHDVKTCFGMDWNGVVSGDAVTNNTCYNRDAGIIVASLSASNNTAPVISGNSIGDAVNWDDTNSGTNGFHHDGIHLFQGAGGVTSGALIYNNYFYGDLGTQSTAQVFLEDPQTGTQVFNNVFTSSNGSSGSNGSLCFKSNGTGQAAYNNTFTTASGSGFIGVYWEGSSGTMKNNVFNNFSNSVYPDCTGVTASNNVYYLAPGGTTCGTGPTGNPNLTSDGHLQSGSSAMGVGANLTSLGITALNSDKTGVARPGGSAWDIGAYQYAAVACFITPTSLSTYTTGQAVSQQFTATNCNSSTFTVSAGSLTGSGLSLSSSGLLSGTALPGSISFTVAYDTATDPLSLTANPTPSITNSGALAAGTVSQAYSQALTTSGGTGALTCSLASGSLPTGLSFTGCTLGGTPSVVGTYNFTAKATDGNSVPGGASNPLSIVIAAADPTAPVMLNVTPCGGQTFPGSCTIPATTTGSLLAIAIVSATGTSPTISSIAAAGGSCQQAGAARSTDTSMADLWYCTGVPAGTTSLTITPNAPTSMAAMIWEFTAVARLDTSAVLNSQAASNTPTGASVIAGIKEVVISIASPQNSITGINAGNACINDSLLWSKGWAHYITSSPGSVVCQWTGAFGTYNSSTAAFMFESPSAGPVYSGSIVLSSQQGP